MVTEKPKKVKLMAVKLPWNSGSIPKPAKARISTKPPQHERNRIMAAIRIKKSHEGLFTKKAKAAGLGVQSYAARNS